MSLPRLFSRMALPAALIAGMSLAPTCVAAASCDPELVSAVEQGDVPSIAMALDAGASIRCADDRGRTLLHVLVVASIEAEDDEGAEAGPISKLLVDRGADPNALDAKGKTPLMLACVLEKIEAVQGLLAAGANPNAAGPDSSSALEYALGTGYVDVVTTLLRGRANPNQRISSKGLPLISAVTMGSPALVELLLRAGADPNLVSAKGTSALDQARSSKNAAMVALLQKPVPPELKLKLDPAPAAAVGSTPGTDDKTSTEKPKR